tara:strand:- start:48 stop:638 length:591 start_codon:yes stop_codon:yes gene_type:complete
MFTIGITGGIGCGKTTASKFFSNKGAFIFNADKEAKNYLKKTISIQHKLINAFGRSVTSQSKLSLKKLADVAFSSPMDQKILNGILWPEIHILIQKAKENAKKNNFDLFIVDAALIIEGKFYNSLDNTILIIAEKNKRINRAIKRNNLPLEQIQQRMMLQLSDSEKKKHSNIIIENNGTIEELYQELNKFYTKIIK